MLQFANKKLLLRNLEHLNLQNYTCFLLIFILKPGIVGNTSVYRYRFKKNTVNETIEIQSLLKKKKLYLNDWN